MTPCTVDLSMSTVMLFTSTTTDDDTEPSSILNSSEVVAPIRIVKSALIVRKPRAQVLAGNRLARGRQRRPVPRMWSPHSSCLHGPCSEPSPLHLGRADSPIVLGPGLGLIPSAALRFPCPSPGARFRAAAADPTPVRLRPAPTPRRESTHTWSGRTPSGCRDSLASDGSPPDTHNRSASARYPGHTPAGNCCTPPSGPVPSTHWPEPPILRAVESAEPTHSRPCSDCET